jgi:N utilization substance protein B
VTEPREQAIVALYEADQLGRRTVDPDAELLPRARRLAEGVMASIGELDRAIEQASEHWTIERMPVVDRAVLRLGLYELRNEPDVPTAVILSEAVRIAKVYSTEKSGMFVNGVLAGLATLERPAT